MEMEITQNIGLIVIGLFFMLYVILYTIEYSLRYKAELFIYHSKNWSKYQEYKQNLKTIK